jgi:hypothetical protein
MHLSRRIRGKKCTVTTNCKKSAEAIVPGEKNREGLNNRKSLVNEGRRPV